MNPRYIKEGIYWTGAVDWDRRLFDSLIPLPDGTSYNSYLVQGSEKTVLLDSVDPSMEHVLFSHLKNTPRVDYIISHHAEQDHSGTLPALLEMYREAKIIANPQAKSMLIDHLHLPEEKFVTVQDGETLSLGSKTLEFIYTPWVHWPETMVTYVKEDAILFSCDFFGSHLASNDLFARDEGKVYEAAKRYYAEIMMPFRRVIQKNLEKIKGRKIDFIAPSHGPVYNRPDFILSAYEDWTSDNPKNVALIPYVSMHGSTQKMVEFLVSELTEKGVTVFQHDLAAGDIGKLAINLVDASTLIIGTPTVHAGFHPAAIYAAYLVNVLRPKLKFISLIGSYGWNTRAVKQFGELITNLKVEILNPVLCKGFPKEADFKAISELAASVYSKHKEHNLL